MHLTLLSCSGVNIEGNKGSDRSECKFFFEDVVCSSSFDDAIDDPPPFIDARAPLLFIDDIVEESLDCLAAILSCLMAGWCLINKKHQASISKIKKLLVVVPGGSRANKQLFSGITLWY